ncbi:MAG: hypothetical protein AABY07_00960 [Nanoarchaeota archaeon]
MANDRVGGVARVSMPVGDGKSSPWLTLESSFDYNAEENTLESRNTTRKNGWAETQKDLQEQLEETLASVQAQLKGG